MACNFSYLVCWKANEQNVRRQIKSKGKKNGFRFSADVQHLLLQIMGKIGNSAYTKLSETIPGAVCLSIWVLFSCSCFRVSMLCFWCWFTSVCVRIFVFFVLLTDSRVNRVSKYANNVRFEKFHTFG